MRRLRRLALCLFLGFVLIGFAFQMGCDELQDQAYDIFDELDSDNPLQDALVDLVGGSGHYTEAQIERGRYLVMNVSLCWECHTPFGPTGPNLDQLFAGGREFIPDVIWTPNITPDRETGVGNYTDRQLYMAITKGIGHFDKNPAGEPLFPIMPYYEYGNMTTEDVLAIIAFLRRGVEPIRNEVPERAPFIIPSEPAQRLDYSSLPGDEDDPGKYLTSAAGICLECHTQRIEGGSPADLNPDMFFAGGVEFDIPGIRVHSANITSHPETGIGNWTRDQIVTAVRDGINPDGIPLCPPMVQFDGMTTNDLNDVINFIRNLPPNDNFVEPCEIEGGPPPQ